MPYPGQPGRSGREGRLDELLALSKQGLVDDAWLAQLAQRSVVCVLSPQDAAVLREVGVNDGVLRYLKGRADGDAALAARIQRGHVPASACDGVVYLGYLYLDYTQAQSPLRPAQAARW